MRSQLCCHSDERHSPLEEESSDRNYEQVLARFAVREKGLEARCKLLGRVMFCIIQYYVSETMKLAQQAVLVHMELKAEINV